MQASAISRMGAEVTQHNANLQQIAMSFPTDHGGSSVYVYDFGGAFSKVNSFYMPFLSHILVSFRFTNIALRLFLT